VPVGHLSMPGPVNITYNDIVGDNDKNKTTLLHWNPGREEFTLRSVLSLIIKKGYGCKWTWTWEIIQMWVEFLFVNMKMSVNYKPKHAD
jgi:hypothetical protein